MVTLQKPGIKNELAQDEAKRSRLALLSILEDSKLTETEVKKANQKWSETFDALTDGISIHSPTFEIVDVNRALCEILGRKREELIGKHCFQVFHGRDCPIAVCPLKAALQDKADHSIEYFEPLFNVWLSISTSPIFNESNTITGVVHVIRNINDRKRAEKALEEFSKDLELKVKERTFELSVLYEVSNIVSYAMDYQQLLKKIMESVHKFIDYDIGGSLLFDAGTASINIRPVYPECAKFTEEVKNGLIDSTAAITSENIRSKHISEELSSPDPSAKPKEGRHLDAIYSFLNVPFSVQGKPIGMVNISSCKKNAFSEDNIKLMNAIIKQASVAIAHLQEVVAAEKNKMRSMVESMVEGIVLTDDKGNVSIVNPAAREMLSMGSDDILTTDGVLDRFEDLREKQFPQKARRMMADVLKGKTGVLSKEIMLKAHPKNTLSFEIEPIHAVGSNDVLGAVTVIRDVTKAKEVDRMKTELISNVSHELRTPLASIRGVIDNLLDGIVGEFTKEQKEYLQMADADSKRLGSLIKDLLDLSRLESGKIEMHIAETDLNMLIEQSIAGVKTQAYEKNISIFNKCPHDIPKLFIDPDKIMQVFVNLFTNAIKFTGNGGRINVAAETLPDEQVKISVTDTGIGLTKEDAALLFQRFQQVGREYGPGAKGFGLGLSICKNIIQLHHGKIWVESEPGKGSNFSFILPIKQKKEILYASKDPDN